MVPAISLAHERKEADIMDRPPRNSATDRLVNRRLIAFAYLQIGIIQALAGFFTYFVLLNDYGYAPSVLAGTGFQWTRYQTLYELDGMLRVEHCGFGFEDPLEEVKNSAGNEGLSLFGAYAKDNEDEGWCMGGCQTPFPGFMDPFIEFTDQGLRGFVTEYTDGSQMKEIKEDGAIENVCGRTCIWYDNLVKNNDDLFQKFIAARGVETDPLRLMLTEDDKYYFNYCCYDQIGIDLNYTTLTLRTGQESVYTTYGFPQRQQANSKQTNARVGSFYWWNGNRQLFPNHNYQEEALYFAQSGYLSSIVVVQWTDLLISKMRKLSVFQQGVQNGWMNFGLVFETVLIIILSHTPFLNTGLGTRPIHILHWFTGFPFTMSMFLYDEIRKYLMHKNPGGWLDRFTYW